MSSPFLKLFTIGPRGLRDLWSAQLALLAAQRKVKTEPIGNLTMRGAAGEDAYKGDPARARAIGAAVSRAARFGVFRPYCLVQTLATRELLIREGIMGSQIRIGVRHYRGLFQAHAWVRWGDEVLGDSPEYVATFTEVDDINVLRTK